MSVDYFFVNYMCGGGVYIMNLRPCEISSEDILDKPIIVMGGTNTGKSTIIKYLLSKLVDDVKVYYIFCPSNVTHGFYNGTVPRGNIYDDLSASMLGEIYKTHTGKKQAYSVANNMSTLESVIDKLGDKKIKRKINRIIDVRQRNIHAAERKDDLTGAKKIKSDSDELLKKIYKHYITVNRDKLLTMDLTPEEESTVNLHDMDYRAVIVFDDCSTELNRIKTSPELKDLYFKGRHSGLTIMTICHSSVTLLPEIKTAASVMVWTDEKTANSTFADTKNYNKDTRKEGTMAAKSVFVGDGYEKLIYFKDPDMYMTILAEVIDDIKLADDMLFDYYDRVKRKSTAGDARYSVKTV